MRLFPKPVGRTANKSYHEQALRLFLFVGGVIDATYPARREMKEILRVQQRKLASPPFSFTEKHGRLEEPEVILALIGSYQSECTLPHQSETPFVGERSFSNEQPVRAGGFFFPLPLPLPQFSFSLHAW